MLGRIKQTDLSVPYKSAITGITRAPKKAKQYPIISAAAKSATAKTNKLLLDQNEMAKGFKYFAIGSFDVSDDGNLWRFRPTRPAIVNTLCN
jgi:oligopeptidase B